MRIYHDWEFLEEGHGKPIHPISVGMVREDGEELYLEFANAPWTAIYKHEWLKANVVPHLDKESHAAIIRGATTDVMKSRLGVLRKVSEFLEDAYKADKVNPIELWGWYSSYDHVCLGQLFGKMIHLPDHVPMWTNDLRQEARRLGVRIPNMRLEGEVAHNALDDARAEMRMHEWLMAYEATRVKSIQIGDGNIQVNTF